MSHSKSTLPLWKRPLHMGWAALIMGVSILISRFMGLIRDKVISFIFGATRESDLYFAAFVIPDFINYLLAGAYFSITLIPLLAAYFERDDEEGWRFFSAVSLWIGLAICSFTAIAMVLAPDLAAIAAPGLDAESSTRLAFFLRIIMPAQICFLLGSCLMALLYLRKQFIVPALAPLIYNLAIIVGGVLLKERGMEGFCWGVLAGALLGNFLLPLVAVSRGGGLRLRPTLFHPGFKRFLILALPLMVGQSIVILDEQFIRVFGSLVGPGAISWLSYARRIMMVPVGVVAQAASVASYPFLAELAAKKETARFNDTLNNALQRVLTLLIPLSLWMMIVSEPTIRLIFQQGLFGVQDTESTAALLRIMLAVVFCWGFQQILGRAFYAVQDTLTPAILGTLTTMASVPVFYFLASKLNATGVAMASAISIVLYSAVLAFWWKRRFGSEAFSGLLKASLKLITTSVISLGPATLVGRIALFDTTKHPYLDSFYSIGVSGIVFAVVFLVLSSRIAPDLIRPFLRKAGGPIERLLIR